MIDVILLPKKKLVAKMDIHGKECASLVVKLQKIISLNIWFAKWFRKKTLMMVF